MSVEKQAEEKSNLVSSEKPKATNTVPEESSHTSASSLSTQSDVVGKQQSEGGRPEDTKHSSVDDAESAISSWLLKLSPAERAASLEFADGAFLSAFLAMVPPSSIRFDGTTDEVPDIEWNTLVSLKDFEAQFLGLMRRYGSHGSEGNASGRAPDANDEMLVSDESEARKSDDAEYASKQPLDSDVFRIQCPDELGSLLRHVCVVFPSATTSQEEKEGDVPIVTVNPSYFESTSDEELLLALGSVRSSFSGLSCDIARVGDEVPSYSSWLLHVSRSARDMKATLHSILLSRLHFAMYDAFRASEAERKRPSNSPARRPVDTPNSESWNEANTTLPVGVENEALFLHSSCKGKDPATDTFCVPDKTVDLRQLLSSMEATTLAECLRPFVEAFLPTTGAHSLQSLSASKILIFTPFRYLAGARQREDFAALDSAVKESVRRILEFVPHQTGATNPCSPTLGGESDPPPSFTSELLPAESCQVNSQSNAACKKKKKKGKRRKQSRKSSNADQCVPTGSVFPAHPNEPLNEVDEDLELEPHPKCDFSEVFPCDVSQPKDEPPHSLQSEDTDLSTVADDVSLKSGVAPLDSNLAKSDGIAVMRVEGGFVAVNPSAIDNTSFTLESVDKGEIRESNHDEALEDGDLWETVEVRTRGNRKKSFGQGYQAARQFHHSNSSFSQSGSNGSFADPGSGPKRNKTIRSPAARKKTASRKVAKDLVQSVLDALDEESKHRHLQVQVQPQQKQQAQQAQGRVSSTSNPWRNGPPLVKSGEMKRGHQLPGSSYTGTQNVAGEVAPKRCTDGVPGSPAGARSSVDLSHHVYPKQNDPMRSLKPPSKVPSPRGAKINAVFGADQNTAPTFQETVSAYSNIVTVAKSEPASVEERASKSDLSSDDTNEAPQNRNRVTSTHSKGHQSDVPPLPKMLSAENANSANSSVASSLEVPHSSCRHHHNFSVDVNDVGYHLLDVCDRLSRDMGLFMSKRSLALNTRRRERGALLAALQSTVASLWPCRGHVEMYGSCATQLDLPSSDLDVVIIGLDRLVGSSNGATQTAFTFSSKTACHSMDVASRCNSSDEEMPDEAEHSSGTQTPLPSRHSSPGSFASMSQSKNAERVVRLASELESQPWAVQVKSIPTATVPVVKVLADPSKLTCSNTGGEWMLRHQHLASQAAAAAGNKVTVESAESLDDVQQFPLWRGADVMNGLLKLDITFEGPEHGGIGSTQFSARVVSEACQEAGVHPDATALVQVVMVLKEILAQRKLNEPYSGGLSSYALLLLVVALLQERAVIREEIERAERQRQAVAAGESSSGYSKSYQGLVPNLWTNASSVVMNGTKSWADHAKLKLKAATASAQDSLKLPPKTVASASSRPKVAVSTRESSNSDPISSMKSSESSWASIARKSSNVSDSTSVKSNQAPSISKSSAATKPTFADAVSRKVSAKAPASHITNQPLLEGIGVAKKPDAENAATPTNVSEAVFQPKVSGLSSSSHYTADESIGAPSFYPQGYNDIIEVLCSGETTAGKLLMHFLLYYGQNFDAQSTAIDISGKHERDFGSQSSPYSYYSPYITRQAAGVIDPVTGMLTVDPIVIYDPLEGAENNNVARRCFAWSSVRWVFAQSYATLCSAVERSATPPTTPGGVAKACSADEGSATLDAGSPSYGPEVMGEAMDPSSPLLRCLLSF